MSLSIEYKLEIIQRALNYSASNFQGAGGRLYLRHCPVCERENWSPHVALGECAWCGFGRGVQEAPEVTDRNRKNIWSAYVKKS